MKIVELWRYPVKSIGGERLDTVEVDEFGISGDRSWGVLDPDTGNILTARRAPKLLMATARLVDDAPVIETADGDTITTATELSDWLGKRVELVRAGDAGGTFENPMDVENESDWVSWTGPGGAFHDSARTRISLVSNATLADRDIRRFRANVLLDGSGEDDLVHTHVRLGTVTLDVRKQIDRCIMVTRPQPGLDADLDVLKRVIRERNNTLGIGAIVAEPGSISLGDRVIAV